MKVNDILVDTVYFGLVMSFLCYWVAMQIRKKLPYPIFNPLLISAIFIISILVIFDIDFDLILRLHNHLIKHQFLHA